MVKWRDRRGQSIVEYLVVATAIVIAILFVRGTLKTNAQNLMTNAANKLNVSIP